MRALVPNHCNHQLQSSPPPDDCLFVRLVLVWLRLLHANFFSKSASEQLLAY